MRIYRNNYTELKSVDIKIISISRSDMVTNYTTFKKS